MNLPAKPCGICRGPVAPATIPHIEGTEGRVRMSIEGMPALACADGHRRFLAPDFAIRMMEALYAGGRLAADPPAAKKGLLRTRYVCAGCGTELSEPAAQPLESRHRIALSGSEPFMVRLAQPRFECASCGKANMLPDGTLRDALLKASVAAFRSAEVAPS
jgi:hypothetical protein